MAKRFHYQGRVYLPAKARVVSLDGISDRGIPGYYYLPTIKSEVIPAISVNLNDGVAVVHKRDENGNHVLNLKKNRILIEEITGDIKLWINSEAPAEHHLAIGP